MLKRTPHRDGSFEYPQHMFLLRNKKSDFQLRTLIWGPVIILVFVFSNHIINIYLYLSLWYTMSDHNLNYYHAVVLWKMSCWQGTGTLNQDISTKLHAVHQQTFWDSSPTNFLKTVHRQNIWRYVKYSLLPELKTVHRQFFKLYIYTVLKLMT